MRGLRGVVAELQGVLAAAAPWIALATGIAAATGASLKFSNEVDRNRQQLTLFTKNVNATNAIIAQLKVTADATSLSLPGLLESTKTLAAYGLRAKDAGTATKLLGDLALGDNEKLQRFAVNLGQISSIGRAYTVDLKQFAMAGIPIFEALSKVMNVSTAEVLRLAEQGKVTYPIVIKAIDELTKKGASFYEGATKGGTDLDRATAQLQGSFESLQTVVGTAVAPLVIKAVDEIKKAVDGLLLLVRQVTNEFQYWGKQKIPLGPFESWVVGIKNGLKSIQDYIDKSPGLRVVIGGMMGGGFGALSALGSAPKASAPAVDRAGLLKSAEEIARKNAASEAANIKLATDQKIAKINQDKEKQLADNRIQYEQQIADFRESTIRRIMDMERSLQDQRVKAEFDLQQSRLKLTGTAQYTSATIGIAQAMVAGKSTADIQALTVARDSAKALNDAALSRRQIEFDSTQRKIQLERALTDFKRETERDIGEMQKNYARQTESILTKAGRTIGELMVKGAQDAAKILEATKPTMPTQPSPIGPAVTKGIIGRTGSTGDSTGPHLDIRWADGRPITKADADKYFALNGRAPSSYGVTSGYGPRSLFGRSFHAGIDFGTPRGTPISLKGGAALTKNLGYTGAGGYAAEISTPQGAMRILHLLANSVAKIPTAAKAGPAAAAAQAPAGSRAMQVDAANAIRPFAAPSTAKLDAATQDLKRANTNQTIYNLLDQQQSKTKELVVSATDVIKASEADLVNAKLKNEVSKNTLDLILNGTNPALAAQFAQNQQIVGQNTLKLQSQKDSIVNSLAEKDLTAAEVVERQKQIVLLDAQIQKQPQILDGMNQEAIKAKALTDEQEKLNAAKERMKGLIQGIGGAIESGLVNGIEAAVTGAQSLQDVLAGVLKDIGKMLISFGIRSLLSGINIGNVPLVGKAAGGPVAGGTPYVVGEKGPELFVPGSSGTIVPADTTAAMTRYQRQTASTGGTAGGAAGDAGASPASWAMNFETTQFLGQDWVSKDQLMAAMAATEKRATAAGAKAGAQQVATKMRTSPAFRRQVGV
jgi:tape measure domain-containing protein